MKTLLMKLSKGDGKLPPKASIRDIVFAGVGGGIVTAILASASLGLEVALILGSFGASCVLVFGYPNVPFSQPRNVVLGHFFSSLVGLICFVNFGATWWSVAIAISLAIMIMMATRTVHPPAGSNPIIIFLSGASWEFLFFPTLIGSVILVGIALIYNNLRRGKYYPEYW